jgi:hypothetical protein
MTMTPLFYLLTIASYVLVNYNLQGPLREKSSQPKITASLITVILKKEKETYGHRRSSSKFSRLRA